MINLTVYQNNTTINEEDFIFSLIHRETPLEKLNLLGVPSLGTTTLFLIMNSAFLINAFTGRLKPLKLAGYSSIILGGIFLIGNMFDIRVLYTNFTFWPTGVAISTAMLFILLGVGVLKAPIKQEIRLKWPT